MGFFDLATRHPQWVKTIIMTGFFLCGILTAIGHHVYYKRLEGDIATSQQDQEYNIKVGTALAFLTKAMLMASVGIALTQIVWRTVRTQPYTLSTLDRLFAVTYSPTNLLSFEVLRYAKVVALVAVCFWLIPFAAITPPGTLSVRIQSFTLMNQEYSVPSFDFEAVAKLGEKAAYSGRTALVLTAGSLSVQNFYSGPAPALKGLATTVAFGKEMLQFPSPCGANCTYPLSFAGPTIKCVKVDWNDKKAPWYTAEKYQQLFYQKTWYNGTTDDDHNFWAAYAYLPHKINGTRPQRSPNYGYPAGDSRLQLKAVKCTQYNTTFHLQVTFRSNQGTIKLVKEEGMKTFNFTPTTQGFVQRGEIEKYGDIYATRAIFDTLFGFQSLVGGSIEERGGASTTTWISGSNIVQTKLAEQWLYSASSGTGGYIDAYYPVEDLGSAIEELHRNVTFSILARPDIIFNNEVKAAATVSGLRNIYTYNRRDLWLSYGAAIIVSAVIVAFGLVCIFTAGDAHDNGFTSIVLAVSNPHLDQVLMNAQAQAGRKSAAPEHLKDVKLQYHTRSEDEHGSLDGFVLVEGSQAEEKAARA